LANRSFAGGGRAWRLSEQLGLDTRLENTGSRRAVEVYPHAALVSLFDLPTVLRYKRGRGRSVEARRAEMLRLMSLVESLSTAEPSLHVEANDTWAAAYASVDASTRPMQLNATEDAVDAVVCAYIALLALRAPARLETFGSEADGAIIVPRSALT
jgi:predicted RNase H-like nuclease